jgi:hypothetical protein
VGRTSRRCEVAAHANRTEGYTGNALYGAAEKGHFEVVQWLYANRPESRLPSAMLTAIRNEHFRIVYWLHSKFPDYKLSRYSEPSYKRLRCCFQLSGKPFEALLFLRAIYPSICTENFMTQTRQDCSRTCRQDCFTATLVLRWLDDNYPNTPATEGR